MKGMGLKRYLQELIYVFIFITFAFIAASRYLPHLWVAACALGMAVLLIFAKMFFILHRDLHRVLRKLDADKRRHEVKAETSPGTF